MRLFKFAAEKEYTEAQVNLGLIYLRRLEFWLLFSIFIINSWITIFLYLDQKGSYEAAFEFFRLAAEQKHILAQYYLAEMYEEGLGAERYCTAAAVCTHFLPCIFTYNLLIILIERIILVL